MNPVFCFAPNEIFLDTQTYPSGSEKWQFIQPLSPQAFNRIKTMGVQKFSSRGLAHPTKVNSYAKAIVEGKPDKHDEANELSGRPLSNNEFMAAAGCEKIVATVYDADEKGLITWKNPRALSGSDHVLVRSPADIVYFSGHGFNLGGSQRFLCSETGEVPELNASIHGVDFHAQRSTGRVYVDDFWNKDGSNEIEYLFAVGCSLLDDDNNATSTTSGGYLWAKTLLHDKRFHGILGFSGNGWTGEDWIARYFSYSKAPITIKSTDAAPAGNEDIYMVDTKDLVSSSQEAIGDVLDFPGNTGRTVSLIDTFVGSPYVRVVPVLTAAVPANSNVTEHTSITRAWRAWMRTQNAKDAGKNLPNEDHYN